jgi:Short C-terminal domain
VRLNVLGNGTMLGAARVNHGTAEVIEAWFRAHPAFGQQETPAAGSASVADELRKLAALREEGLLTDAEFAAAKRQLIGG